MAKMTRKQDLQRACKDANCFVMTWSPGDGVTRYRFFDLDEADPKSQDYSGPFNGIHTALGLKNAYKFLQKRGFVKPSRARRKHFAPRRKLYRGR